MNIALRREVAFADERCEVTSLLEETRQFDGIPIGYFAITEKTVMPGRHACKQSSARGRASGRRRIGTTKARAFVSEAIEIRSVYERIAIARERIATELIGHEEQDVRF